MTADTVSIITPSFNQAAFLEYCLNTIYAQRPAAKFEHIVMDGGSTDDSVLILERNSHKIDVWQSRTDKGQSDAINRGFQISKGEILTWINSDDGLASGAVEAMREALSGREDAAWGIGGCRVIDVNGDLIREWRPPKGFDLPAMLDWSQNFIFQPAVFWNRKMWDAVGGLEEKLHFAMDFDLWIRFFLQAPPVILHAPIGIHRTQGESKTSNVKHEIYEEYVWALKARLNDAPRLRNLGLRHVARALALRGNAAMFSKDRASSRKYLSLALRTSAGAALTEAHLWKAALRYLGTTLKP